MMRVFLHTVLFFLISLTGSTQKATLDFKGAKEIKIGEQTDLILGFEFDEESTSLIWPRFSDTLTGDIEIIELDSVHQFETNGIIRKEQKITITAWDSGYYAIPPIQVIYNSDTFKTNGDVLGVHTVEVDTTKAPKDIKDIYNAHYQEPELSLWDKVQDNWTWILLGALLIVALALVLLASRKKKKEKKAYVPLLSPHEEAFKDLKDLEQQKLWQAGKVKTYHIRIAEILRKYIERRYEVRALEQTTDEILQNLRFADMKAEPKRLLRQVLKLSDLVKFAKENPIGSENEQSLRNARRFIELTKMDNPMQSELD